MSDMDVIYQDIATAETFQAYDSYDPEYRAALEDLAETVLEESRRMDEARRMEEGRIEENRRLDDERRMEERRQLQRMQEDRKAEEKRQEEKRNLEEKKAEPERKEQSKVSDDLSKKVKLGALKGIAEMDGRKVAVVENIIQVRGYKFNSTVGYMEKKTFYVPTGTYSAIDIQTGKRIPDKFRLEESQVSDDKIAQAVISKNSKQAYELMEPSETEKIKTAIRIQQDNEYEKTRQMHR